MAAKRKSTKRSRKTSTKQHRNSFSILLYGFIAGAMAVGLIWFVIAWKKTPFSLMPTSKPVATHFSNKLEPRFTFNSNQVKPATTATPSKLTAEFPSPPQEPAPEVSSSPPQLKTEHNFIVYLNAYPNFHRADNERAYLILRGFNAQVSKSSLLNEYLLWIGPFASLEAAYHVEDKLKSEYQQSRITTN